MYKRSLGAGDVSRQLNARQLNACLHAAAGKVGFIPGVFQTANCLQTFALCKKRSVVVVVQGRCHHYISHATAIYVSPAAQSLFDNWCELNRMNRFNNDGLNTSSFIRFLKRRLVFFKARVSSITCRSVVTAVEILGCISRCTGVASSLTLNSVVSRWTWRKHRKSLQKIKVGVVSLTPRRAATFPPFFSPYLKLIVQTFRAWFFFFSPNLNLTLGVELSHTLLLRGAQDHQDDAFSLINVSFANSGLHVPQCSFW